MVWLNQYEKTIKAQYPDMRVNIYCDQPRCVLEATTRSNRSDISENAQARLRHMIDRLGNYGGRNASASF